MAKKRSSDFPLFFIVTVLVIIGIIMVFSSSYYYALARRGDAYYFVVRNIAWAAIGFVGMFVTSQINYRIYKKLAPLLFIVSIVLLGLVFTPLGVTINYATRWIGVGKITIMPGEIAKVCAIIFTAYFLDRNPSKIKSLFRGVIPLLLVVGTYFTLIILQPNLSTAITVSTIIIAMMFVAGMKYSHFFGIGLLGVIGIVAMIVVEPYRLKRLTSFLDPFADPMDTGYQVIQSLLALGSGGLFGVGLGKSIQKTLYLPEPQNDFIFAIIGEELGFIGCSVLIILFIILIWRGIHIAMNAPDLFGSLLASGVTAMIAIQVVINIAVATSSMPPTGIALPFISWGGNSLAIFMASIGILLNISKYNISNEQ
jgi:cell division protein FtsW